MISGDWVGILFNCFSYFFPRAITYRCSSRRTVKDPDGHGLDRVQDVPEIRGHERWKRDTAAEGSRSLGVRVHRPRAEQGLQCHDRLPPGNGPPTQHELGVTFVHLPPGYGAARAPTRGRAAPRTGPRRPRQRGDHLLGKHRQEYTILHELNNYKITTNIVVVIIVIIKKKNKIIYDGF